MSYNVNINEHLTTCTESTQKQTKQRNPLQKHIISNPKTTHQPIYFNKELGNSTYIIGNYAWPNKLQKYISIQGITYDDIIYTHKVKVDHVFNLFGHLRDIINLIDQTRDAIPKKEEIKIDV